MKGHRPSARCAADCDQIEMPPMPPFEYGGYLKRMKICPDMSLYVFTFHLLRSPQVG